MCDAMLVADQVKGCSALLTVFICCCRFRVNTKPIWNWPGLPPAIPRYNNWWWPPKGPAWWLSRIGQLHSLQLPLYLIDPDRGMRT